jgi:hypothetical protein
VLTREVALLPNEARTQRRDPRLRVLLNGQTLTGAYEADINSNNHWSADCFRVAIALGPDDWADAKFWSSEANMIIDVQLSLDGGESFSSAIQGTVDTVEIEPIAGDVRIRGRDFTSALIEAPTQETFANRTASEIATMLAYRHSLVPSVIPTTTPVGRFYQSDHESITLNSLSRVTTEWDLLVFLAQQENCDVYVGGNSLYFQPMVDPSAISCVLQPSDLIEIRLERSLMLAQEIQVAVKSWNTQQRAAFVEQVSGTVTGTTSGSSPLTGPARQYVLICPNLTPDRASAVAMQRLNELIRHERTIDLSMPGELVLAPRNVVLLSGTGTDFDQAYYVESLDRKFSIRTGFVQQVRANNTSPRTISTLTSVS